MLNKLLSLCFWVLVLGRDNVVLSSSSSASASSKGPSVGVANPQNPFVKAAPLIVGAVCHDGVVLVALHTAFDKEPLLLSDSDNSTTTPSLPDLPKSFRGPFRIYNIDALGTALVCAGWRADGQILADYCRSVAAEEVKVFGTSSSGSSEYGQCIASEASAWMAQCAVSEGSRALSCVGLLASTGTSSEGYLWLIDATGAYRVRAHAVGGDALAGIVNEKLRSMELDTCTAEDACRELLTMLQDSGDLPARTRVELARVASASSSNGRGKLQRLLSSNLFGVTKRTSAST